MNKILLLFILLGGALNSLAQSNFPTSWLGKYEGMMHIEDLSGVVDSVHVSLDLLPKEEKNSWTYRFTYNSLKWGKIVNDYEMRWHDSLQSPNLFILDEHNGLLLTEQFINNRFYGHYEVEGMHYLTLLKQNDTDLYFEIRCTDPQKGLKTRSVPDAEGSQFDVSTYFHFMIQYVDLHPIKISGK